MNLEARYKEAKTDSLSEQVAFCKLIDSFIDENPTLDIPKKKVAFVPAREGGAQGGAEANRSDAVRYRCVYVACLGKFCAPQLSG